MYTTHTELNNTDFESSGVNLLGTSVKTGTFVAHTAYCIHIPSHTMAADGAA